MFELLGGARKSQRFVWLNKGFKLDLQWWHLFMAEWNGRAMMSAVTEYGPQLYSGCFRFIWMWGLLGLSVVPASVAHEFKLYVHSSKRTPSHHVGRYFMGGSVDRVSGDGTL